MADKLWADGSHWWKCAGKRRPGPELAAHVGVQRMYDHLTNSLEITTLVGEGPVSDMDLSPLVRGGMTNGITAAELAAAYTMYGGGEGYGVHTTLHCYTAVLNAAGETLLEPEVTSNQAVRPSTGYIMNRLMRGVLTNNGGVSGTANGLALTTTDSVGKTGTTSDDRDRWFVGITPEYISAVWWGYDENQTLEWPARASTNPPVNVWRTVMDAVQAGSENTAFAPPPNTVVQREFLRGTGQLMPEGEPGEQVGWYDTEQLARAGDTIIHQPESEPESKVPVESQEPPAPESQPPSSSSRPEPESTPPESEPESEAPESEPETGPPETDPEVTPPGPEATPPGQDGAPASPEASPPSPEGASPANQNGASTAANEPLVATNM